MDCRVCKKQIIIIRQPTAPIVINGRAIEQRPKHIAIHDDGESERVYMELSRIYDLRRELEAKCRATEQR